MESAQIDDRLESFVEAMYEASNILLAESPDFILAPMNGSVPLVDAMTIVNSDFDPSKVVYMPASSKIEGVNEVISEWYLNFLKGNITVPSRIPKVIGIDEVVSGGSVVRCVRSIDRAINSARASETQSLIERLALGYPNLSIPAINDLDSLTDNEHAFDLVEIKRRVSEGYYGKNPQDAKSAVNSLVGMFKSALGQRLTYRTIGLEDSKREGKRNREYSNLKDQGRIIPVGVKTIITMDIPDFCPPRFMENKDPKDKRGYARYFPLVQDFYVTPRYLHFLQKLAVHVGKNPNEVNPVNMIPIMESNRYLPSYSNLTP
jgi:hypothetical protein